MLYLYISFVINLFSFRVIIIEKWKEHRKILKIDQLILNYLDAEKQLIDLVYKSGTTEKNRIYAIIKKQEKLLFEVRQEYQLYGETGEIRIVEIENAEQKLEKWKDIMKNKTGWMPKEKQILNNVNDTKMNMKNKETKETKK